MMMTGNIPSYLHTQSSLPNSREERQGPGERDGSESRLKEMEVERDKDRQGWREEDEAQTEGRDEHANSTLSQLCPEE